MRVLGIIPARGGSRRVPRKNLRLLAGKPLTAWAIETALSSRKLAQTVVSSDDPEILALAARYDARLPLARPSELATDVSLAIDFVRHALDWLAATQAPFDAVAIIQPSSPFTSPEDVDGVIDLLERSGAESAVSMVEVDHSLHPLKWKVMQGDRLFPYLDDERGRMASHQMPKIYVRNCSVYVSRCDVHARGLIVGDDCRGYVMPRDRSLDINDETDWAFASFMVERRLAKTARQD